MSEQNGLLVKNSEDTHNFKYLRISSKERISGTASNFKMNFGAGVELDKIRQVNLVSASIINQLPNISVYRGDTQWGNSRFVYTHSVTGLHDVIIPDGQYTTDEFIPLLKAGIDLDIAPDSVTITQGAYNKKLTFTLTNGANTLVIYSLDSLVATNYMGDVLGFTSDSVASDVVTADALPNMLGEQVIYIHSNDLSKGKTLIGAPSTNNNNVQGAFTIPVTEPFGANIKYIGKDNDKIFFPLSGNNEGAGTLRELQIVLRGNQGRELKEMTDNFESIIVLKAFY